MPAVRTNGAVFGCATKISAQVMPRMMMAVLKFSVNFQVRRNVSAPKAKRTAGALKPFNFLPFTSLMLLLNLYCLCNFV